MTNKPAARGNAVLLGLALERAFNVPSNVFVGYDPILPVDGSLGFTSTDSPQVNRSGYTRAGMPGDRGGSPFEFHHPLTAGHTLEFLQHVFRANVADGSLVKTELEVGDVFQYDFFPVPVGVETSFTALIGRPPVDLSIRTGIRFGIWNIPLGEGVLPQDLVGLLAHGGDVGPAVPEAGNVGTYDLGPWVRGPAKDPEAGPFWVRVEGLAPLTFKVLQALALPDGPTFAAAATVFTVAVDAAGEAVWQDFRSSATNLDLGMFDEDKDPLQGIFPGTAVEHADLEVGDIFQLPLVWVAPALSTISGHQRFSRAHWRSFVRAVGAGAWEEIQCNSGTVGFSAAVEGSRGNSSNYPHAIDRTGEAIPTLQLVRDYRDRYFRDRQARHVEARQLLEGQQLGTGAFRESIDIVTPNAQITSWAAPAASAGKIVETVDLVGRTNDAGDPPVTVTVITSRDWTPAA